jgi:hypothetical protein
MDPWLYVVGISAVIGLAWAWVAMRRGPDLRRKFQILGTLKGRTKAEIVGAVGLPTSMSALADGQTLLQWQTLGYHIALGFDAHDVCYGVTHEFSGR